MINSIARSICDIGTTYRKMLGLDVVDWRLALVCQHFDARSAQRRPEGALLHLLRRSVPIRAY